jgi:DNA processing protein
MKRRNKSENLYWVWLGETLGAGNRYVNRLMDFFGSAFDVYNATEEDLIRSGCVNEQVAAKLAEKSLKRAYSIIDYCALNNIGILSYVDENYPERLKMLQDPPAVLYYKGTLPNFVSKLCIAVVGTRKISDYGKRAAYKIAYELASAGAVVVSGMALGVDSVAACGALVADGKTVAVLGCGIDVIYPTQHAKLQRTIEERGLVITEYSPGTKPFGANFPIRNRIISGLSQGTLVVEADEKSGAMITAKCALMQGRGVFALPGNIDESNSIGTNSLIRDGAAVATCAEDILINYELLYGKSLNYSALAFAKSTFDESLCDRALDKLGIAARPYKKVADEPRDTSHQLRPTRKPPAAPEPSRPSTSNSIGKKLKAIVESKKTDNTEKLLSELSEENRSVFLDFPLDHAVSMDDLCRMGHPISQVMAALTVLEMRGLISTLPGNLYIRR